ncbi:MAG: signal peptide peptidase SppA [Proteobacteria bacterium]|nr:signal peptide peptidase SppA [Pseudomonadota bacterium]
MAAFPGIARRLAANAARVGRRTALRGLVPGNAWLLVRLGPGTGDQRPPAISFGKGPRLGLFDALRVLEAAAEDDRLDGVLLRFHGGLPGWSAALALRRAVERLREVGKPVVAWGESLGAQEYLVASAASRVWLPESGSLYLVGLRLEQFFLRDLLAHLDIEPEVVRVGSYKTAGELLTRGGMSPEQREQLEGWIDDLFGELVEGISRGRGLSPDDVRERIDEGPYPARLAVERGLLDDCLYPDEIPAALAPLAAVPATGRDGPRRAQLVEAEAYLAHAADAGWQPLWRDLPRMAYVVASGAIHRGSGARGGITSDGFRELLDGLGRERAVRGVVLRVDSPGGDAVASDLLFRAVSRLSREKPVVVSMGDVAASGGYYLASAADSVFAEAGTLTGSIGVVGGKLNLEGLYRRLGIAKDAIERGARAGLQSEVRAFTPDERSAVKREMEALYATFVARVAEGRALSVETVRRLAQGRVWSGARARSHGLIDAIGGPLDAMREARRRAGIGERERVLVEFHPRRSRWLDLRSLLASSARARVRVI